MGPELMEMFTKQAERFGTTVLNEIVTKVDFSARPFKVWAGEKLFEASTVIVSTGASAKWLGIPGEVELGGYGVSACATCDGFFFRNKEVIVVGGGDTAMEEANYLTRHCSKVYLIHRRHEFRASKIMQDRVLNNPKIEVIYNAKIDEIHGSEMPKKVTSVTLSSTVEDKTWTMDIDGVFVAIGHQPNTELFKGILDMESTGYLIAKPGTASTNIPGVFVAGDAADSVYRQAITAAGTGCMAAIEAERFLEAEGH